MYGLIGLDNLSLDQTDVRNHLSSWHNTQTLQIIIVVMEWQKLTGRPNYSDVFQ